MQATGVSTDEPLYPMLTEYDADCDGIPDRTDTGVVSGSVAVRVTGLSGVAENPAAVVLNLTASRASAQAHVTVYPCGMAVPSASTLNVGPGAAVSNLVIARPGADGRVCFFVSSPLVLTADLQGSFASGEYTSLSAPKRIADTRSGTGGPKGVLAAGQVAVIDLAKTAVIPNTARAVVLNLTSVKAQGAGSLTVFPCGGAVPTVSSLNFRAGVTTPNLVIVRPNASGKVCVRASATTDVVADVSGYFAVGASFSAVAPARLLDTRNGTGRPKGAIKARMRARVRLAGAAGVPREAVAAALNLTVVAPASGGAVTLFSCDATAPPTPNVRTNAGTTRANAVIAAPDVSGDICLIASMDTHVVLDVDGYTPAGSTYTPVTPRRIFDTETGLGVIR